MSETMMGEGAGNSELGFRKKKMFLLGFGFLGVSIIWSMYNAYVPVFLRDSFNLKFTLVGGIMTFDNILAILLLPFLGALSDKTRSPLGKRRPYILIGAPLALIFFILIPIANSYQRLGLMMTTIIFMNISMALFRSPVIALMPDITPSKHRSEANGIINFMGGVGALLVFFGGKPLYDSSPALPFVVGGSVMFAASMLVVLFIREDKPYRGEAQQKNISFRKSLGELKDNLRDVIKGEKSLLFTLSAIFLWFVGFNTVETFFTSYAKFYMGLSESTGALILGFYSAMFIIMAIPAGFIGSKFGRRRTITFGLLMLIVLLITAVFFRTFLPVAILFAFAGAFWSMVNVNSLPMVVDMTVSEKVGGYTGLYYFFSQAANIVAPPLGGGVMDLATAGGERPGGYVALLIFASVFFAAAMIIMLFVRRGEAVNSDE
ncbi:MFS transporter [Salinispira pacifica]|uniref:Putative glycerol transport protein n=1 Tax=Salinispira pacifica TaxID=1307761 RepID=V5WMC4_9SPIO|nr:MFS transporter [Salinispira pacifica]AHC16785.1 putative glycerol transport protein [Salinispira pacifica]